MSLSEPAIEPPFAKLTGNHAARIASKVKRLRTQPKCHLCTSQLSSVYPDPQSSENGRSYSAAGVISRQDLWRPTGYLLFQELYRMYESDTDFGRYPTTSASSRNLPNPLLGNVYLPLDPIRILIHHLQHLILHLQLLIDLHTQLFLPHDDLS